MQIYVLGGQVWNSNVIFNAMTKELSTSIDNFRHRFRLQALLRRSQMAAILELNQETTRCKSTKNVKQWLDVFHNYHGNLTFT